MARYYIILIILLFPLAAEASKGKILLNNGKSITGDISRCNDGTCLVVVRAGSIRFEQEEIKKIIIYSGRDTATEKFVNTMKVTPGQRASAGAAPSAPYESLIHQSAKENNIDPALLKAVMKAESNFNPKDKSKKGACGLMQLMPETAKLLGVKDIYSPEENVHAGAKFLSCMLDTFHGNTEKALAAYNAGPAAVLRYNSVPPYLETRNYIKNVHAFYRKYRGADGSVHSYTDESGRITIYNVR
jgi:hypothetical protein